MHNKLARHAMQNRRKPLTRIDARVSDELYDLVLSEAEKENISLGEVLTRAVAEKLGRPELGIVEKEKPGPKPRPRTPTREKNGVPA